MQVTTRFFSRLLVLMLLLAAPFALAAPSTPTEDFTDNLDGTVTHRITGLTWMRCAMGMTWDGTTCTGTASTASTYSWNQATKLTANFAGRSDWRLPSISELNTIVEWDGSDPMINGSIFPNTPGYYFWTSSRLAETSIAYAWVRSFYARYGYAGTPDAKGFTDTSGTYYVRLVRGGQTLDPLAPSTPLADFVENGDGTVTHIKTGLMWKRCAEGQAWIGTACSGSALPYDWTTASSLTSSSAGHNDWRIPTEAELLTIVEFRGFVPAINTTIFPNTSKQYSYWSGTRNAYYLDSAWYVNFDVGVAEAISTGANNAVLLVRAGQFFGPLGFATQTGVALGTVMTSNVLKIASSGNAGAPISIIGGSYAINGGVYTTAPGTVQPNDSITVQVMSALGFETTTRATVTVGGIGGNFIVTTVGAPDSLPPSVPTDLTVTPSTDSAVTLSWDVALDNVGVTTYRVYRNGGLIGSLGAVTSYTDTGLSPATSYSYRVAACDASNNCSALSPATVTTLGSAVSIVPVHSTPTKDFLDNGDGTVTHRITGLTWMRCAMGMTWTGATCKGDASNYTWDQAIKLTANFAGKSDWRLPSGAELNSIVERDGSNPKINVTIFPNTAGLLDAANSYVWSASLLPPPFDSSAGAVTFSDGRFSYVHISYDAKVWLVRADQSFDSMEQSTPSTDFVDNGDGTVTHIKTGLMWKRCAEGQFWGGGTCSGNASTYGWRTALALTSSSASHVDWRMPSVNELMTIVEFRGIRPAINTAMFPNSPSSGFYSGSPSADSSDGMWFVDFGYGYASYSSTVAYAARLVRSGQYFGAWGFTGRIRVETGTTVTAHALKVYGSGGNIKIIGGQYSINGGPYTAAAGTINSNDSVSVQVISAPTPSTTTIATLTIGTVSGDFSVTTAPDAQPPAVPVSLSATQSTSATGPAGFKLTWSASSDNTGVTHYRIYRNGSLLGVVNNPTTTYTDSHATSSTQFTYTVQACDAAYNCSALSKTSSATRSGNVSIAPQLATGAGHSASIKNDGSLLTWGFNETGQLGTGVSGNPITSSQRPSSTLSSIYTVVATGASHTLAIKLDGTLWSWGGNASGQLGDGTTTSRNAPLQIGTGFMSIAAGNSHGLAIKTDGTLWSWGNNGTGQLGDGTSNSTSTPIQIGNGFYTVSAGATHTVAIKLDGTLWTWGSNNFGQLGDGTGNDRYAPQMIGSGFTAAAAGAFHTIAIKNDGTLWAWGQNTNGQLGDGTTQNRYAPVPVGSGYNVLTGTLAAGSAHSLALKPDGSLWAWGSNASGQLGDGTTTDSLTPKAIDPTSVFTTLAVNANHSLALKPEGTVWSWGANSTGQLGDATLASRQSSALVLNETVDGALDLIPEVANTIPADKLPSFLVQVAKSANVTSTVKYNSDDLNQNGSVYIVAYLRPDSPLLLPSANPTSKIAGGILTKDTGCPANTTGTVPAVLTRGGWKQADCTTPTLPLYTGTLDTANNTFGMYVAAQFDQTKDNGLFCVGYAGASTSSAKGLIRSVVSGVDANLNICPPIQLGAIPDTTAPSVPLNIIATAAGPGQVNLTWNAATDAVGVVRYNIYRGDSIIATLDNVTSFTDSSPQASTAYSYSVMACDAAANCSGQSTQAQAATPAQPNVMLGAGWNLVGNGGSTTMNVPSLFGDVSKIYSLWKWVKAGSTPNVSYPAWAFYTPGQADSGAAYAASKGYDTFTSITSGEGFWVNAKSAFSVPMTAPAWILSSVFAPNQSKALTPGWSLIATGEAQTASAFNKAMSTTPPIAGAIPINLTSLWAWQNSVQRWYFYAPSLEASSGLNAYLNEMNYLDLGSFSFTPTMGFWVNR